MSEDYGEPWKTDDDDLMDKNNIPVGTCEYYGIVGIDYVRRIAACVNYCKGIPTEELEKGCKQ